MREPMQWPNRLRNWLLRRSLSSPRRLLNRLGRPLIRPRHLLIQVNRLPSRHRQPLIRRPLPPIRLSRLLIRLRRPPPCRPPGDRSRAVMGQSFKHGQAFKRGQGRTGVMPRG
jgi:hypothetical protein